MYDNNSWVADTERLKGLNERNMHPIVEDSVRDFTADDKLQKLLEHAEIDDSDMTEKALEEVEEATRIQSLSIMQDLGSQFDFQGDESEYVVEYLQENPRVRENPHLLVLGTALATSNVDSIKDGKWRAYRLSDAVMIEKKEDGTFDEKGKIDWDICQYCVLPYARNRQEREKRDHPDHEFDTPFRSLDNDGLLHGSTNIPNITAPNHDLDFTSHWETPTDDFYLDRSGTYSSEDSRSE